MPDFPAPVARLRSVTKSLAGRTVLDGIDLEVRPGEVTALLGPNGAGKTTSVGVLIGRLTADGGSAELFGLDPSRPAARARLGVMLQSAGLPDVLTVAELIRLQSGYFRDPRDRPQLPLGGIGQARCVQSVGSRTDRPGHGMALTSRVFHPGRK